MDGKNGSGNEGASFAATTSLCVQRAIGGDRASLGWVVGHFQPLLVAQARLRLGASLTHLADPDDLVAEVWLVTLDRLAELRPRDGRWTPVLLKFMSSVLRNKIKELMRSRLRNAEASASAPDTDAATTSQLPADASGVVSAAARGDTARKVSAVLERLSEAEREIVLLRGVEQLTFGAAAAITGELEDTLRVRYRRTVEKLRRDVADSVFDELASE